MSHKVYASNTKDDNVADAWEAECFGAYAGNLQGGKSIYAEVRSQ